MKIYSLFLIISLIIIGIVFNLYMVNYIYRNAVYRNKEFENGLKKINETEKMFSNGDYKTLIIYSSKEATLIKLIFDNGVEGIKIQEE